MPDHYKSRELLTLYYLGKSETGKEMSLAELGAVLRQAFRNQ